VAFSTAASVDTAWQAKAGLPRAYQKADFFKGVQTSRVIVSLLIKPFTIRKVATLPLTAFFFTELTASFIKVWVCSCDSLVKSCGGFQASLIHLLV
jgi:hypothetical protein